MDLNEKKSNKNERSGRVSVLLILLAVLIVVTGVYIFYLSSQTKIDEADSTDSDSSLSEQVESDTRRQLDVETGLVLDAGWQLVKANCTGCHSSALVTQNRATREGWEGMIRWMQRTQKLWDLGENEQAILDYLAKNYAPEGKGRRENLKDIEWYELETASVSDDR